MPKKRKKSNVIKVDFRGVKTLTLMEEKDYKVKVVEIEEDVGQSGFPYLTWKFEVVGGKHEGRILYHNTSLQTESLWNLKGVLIAQGIKVPESIMELDLAEIIQDAEACVASVFTDEYDNKKRSKISDLHNPSDVSVEDDYDNAETVEKPDEDQVKKMSEEELEDTVGEFELDIDLDEIKGVKKKRKAVIKALDELEEEDDEEDDDEEDDDDDEDDENEAPSEDEINKMKRKELDKVVKDHDLDMNLDSIKGVKKQRAAVIEELSDDDEDDEDDDDDDEEEEKEKPTKKEVKAMDDEGLEDVVFEHSLDVDLDDFKTEKAKKKAIIKALKL